MALKLITAPTVLAVSLEEAKVQCRAEGADEDALITAYIKAATEWAEHKTGRALLPQTWELTLDAFPEAFELPRPPVVSVTSLTYWDAAGVQQQLDNSGYVLDNADDFGPAYVVPAYGTSWPATRSQLNAVALRYVAGYPDAASVPEGIRDWIKLQVGAMFKHREAEGSVQMHALGRAESMLDRYKLWVL